MKHPKVKFVWDPNKSYEHLDSRVSFCVEYLEKIYKVIEEDKKKILKSKNINQEAFSKFVAGR